MRIRSQSAFGIFLFSAIVLASCAPSGPSGTLTKASIVLDWTVNTNHTGIYVARDLGYFKEQGLDVTILSAPETGAAALLAAGKADFAVSAQEEVIQSHSAEVSLVAVAAIISHNTSGFAARAASAIARPKDFEGRKYGGWGSPTEEAILKAVVKGDGGDGSLVQILNMGSLDFFGATEKLVDFAWIFQAWDGVQAELRGVELNFIELKKFDPALDFYTPVIAVNSKTIGSDPGLIRKFLAGLSMGYRYAVEHPEQASAVLLKAAPDLNAELVLASQKFLAGQYQADAPRWGQFDEKRWNAFLNWLGERGLLKEKPEALSGLFTNEFLP